MSSSVLPIFSSKSFIVSGLTFRSLIDFKFIFAYYFYFFIIIFIGVLLIYNVVLVSDVQQCGPVYEYMCVCVCVCVYILLNILFQYGLL